MDAKDFMPDAAALAQIRRDIEAYEAERAAVYARVRWRILLWGAIDIVAVIALAWLFNVVADPRERWLSPPHVFLYVIGVGAAIAGYAVAMAPARRMQLGFRKRLLPIIFGFIQDLVYVNGQKPGSFDRLPAGLVGAFSHRRFDDVFTGRYAGFAFELYEVRLTTGSRRRQRLMLGGIIMAFEMVAAFPGLLIATHRSIKAASFFRGIFGGSEPPELASGISELDERYEFRSDNPVAALALITGRLARTLQWLTESWPDGTPRVAINGSDGFLVLPTQKNYFELPGISAPLDYDAHVAPLIADMATFLAIAALLRQVGGADGEASLSGSSNS